MVRTELAVSKARAEAKITPAVNECKAKVLAMTTLDDEVLLGAFESAINVKVRALDTKSQGPDTKQSSLLGGIGSSGSEELSVLCSFLTEALDITGAASFESLAANEAVIAAMEDLKAKSDAAIVLARREILLERWHLKAPAACDALKALTTELLGSSSSPSSSSSFPEDGGFAVLEKRLRNRATNEKNSLRKAFSRVGDDASHYLRNALTQIDDCLALMVERLSIHCAEISAKATEARINEEERLYEDAEQALLDKMNMEHHAAISSSSSSSSLGLSTERAEALINAVAKKLCRTLSERAATSSRIKAFEKGLRDAAHDKLNELQAAAKQMAASAIKEEFASLVAKREEALRSHVDNVIMPLARFSGDALNNYPKPLSELLESLRTVKERALSAVKMQFDEKSAAVPALRAILEEAFEASRSTIDQAEAELRLALQTEREAADAEHRANIEARERAAVASARSCL